MHNAQTGAIQQPCQPRYAILYHISSLRSVHTLLSFLPPVLPAILCNRRQCSLGFDSYLYAMQQTIYILYMVHA